MRGLNTNNMEGFKRHWFAYTFLAIFFLLVVIGITLIESLSIGETYLIVAFVFAMCGLITGLINSI